MPVSAPPPRESRPSFVSAVAGTYLTNAFVAGLSLANVLITARALGPEGRGGLAFMTTMAMLTATLASLGVEEANGNLAGTQPGLRRALATNSVVIALVVGCSAAGLLLGLIEAFPSVGGDSTPALRWIAMASDSHSRPPGLPPIPGQSGLRLPGDESRGARGPCAQRSRQRNPGCPGRDHR